MVYQKPKLLENSVKREKKMILLNEKPMTTKRPMKNFNYMEKIKTKWWKSWKGKRKNIKIRARKKRIIIEIRKYWKRKKRTKKNLWI